MRILPLLLILSLLCSCGGVQPSVDTEPAGADSVVRVAEPFGAIDSSLQESLRTIERMSGGLLGCAAIHLESGWRTSYRGRETFPMASVAKLPMAIEFLRQVDSGAFHLDSLVHLTATDHRPGASVLYHRTRHAGGVASLHALLEAMVAASDNTASDVLLRLAGGAPRVDALMTTLGLEGIDVSHDEGELILLWAGVDPGKDDSVWTRDRFYGKIAEAGDTAWNAAAARLADDPADAAMPEEMATLLAKLHRGELLARPTTDTLLAIMHRTATGRRRIPALLPAGTPVAHKTGTISSTTNDVGIIQLPDGRGHLAIALFIKDSHSGVRQREHAIAAAAQLVVQHVMARENSIEVAGR